jgi:hypothetical protein
MFKRCLRYLSIGVFVALNILILYIVGFMVLGLMWVGHGTSG